MYVETLIVITIQAQHIFAFQYGHVNTEWWCVTWFVCLFLIIDDWYHQVLRSHCMNNTQSHNTMMRIHHTTQALVFSVFSFTLAPGSDQRVAFKYWRQLHCVWCFSCQHSTFLSIHSFSSFKPLHIWYLYDISSHTLHSAVVMIITIQVCMFSLLQIYSPRCNDRDTTMTCHHMSRWHVSLLHLSSFVRENICFLSSSSATHSFSCDWKQEPGDTLPDWWHSSFQYFIKLVMYHLLSYHQTF